MSKIYDDDHEPSLEDIDDFKGTETAEKRNTVRLVVLFILIVGAVFTYFKYENTDVKDYVGTIQNPGIDTTKGK